MEKGLLEKTGKPLAHWIRIVTKSKIEKHNEIVKFLKSDHGFTHGFANFVALKAKKTDAGSIDNETLLTNQYKGKENLLNIYKLFVNQIMMLGEDITFVPKKMNVSVKTTKQFALIQPSTKTRIDLGLKLRNIPIGSRLQGSGSFGSMCSHRVQIFSTTDIDNELLEWIRQAYLQSKS